jgi:hypothetical protein
MQGSDDFLRNYAEKRATQMEKARVLREQRVTQQRGTSGGVNYGGSSSFSQSQQYAAPQPQQAQQQQQRAPPPAQQPTQRAPQFEYPPPVNRDPPQTTSQRRGPEPTSQYSTPQASRQPTQSYGGGGGYQAPPQQQQYQQQPQYQQQQQPQYQPQQQQQQPQYQQQQYQQPQSYQSQPSRSAPQAFAQPVQQRGPSGEAIAVSETDFRRAVSLGVISQDQARQLWTIVSSGGGAPPPAQRYSGGNGNGNGSGPTGYDPNMYAPSSAPAVDRRPPVKEPVQAPPRQSVSSSQKRPEWNGDDGGLQHENSNDGYNNAPPPRAAGSGHTPGRVRPQIPARGAAKEWNSEASEPVDSGFGAAPPVPGRRRPPAPMEEAPTGRGAPLDQDTMPVGGGRTGPKKDPFADAYPSGQAPPPASQAAKKASLAPGAASRAAAGRRAGPSGRNQQPDPEPSDNRPQDVVADELDEMERQKEEARLRLEQELEEAQEAAANERMIECKICERRFRESIIQRHEKACKVSSKPRKAFDTKAQRLAIEGAEDVLQAQLRPAKSRQQPKSEAKMAAEAKAAANPNKLPKWKMQHEAFQAAMQMNKHIKAAESGAAVGPPPSMPASHDDRVSCPYCSRKFAEDVAERHIPKCKTTVNKPRAVGARR